MYEAHSTKPHVDSRTIGYALLVLFCILMAAILVMGQFMIPFAILLAILATLVIVKYPFIALLIYSIFFFIRPQEFVFFLTNSPIPIERSVALLIIVVMLFKFKFKSDLKLRLLNIDISLLSYLVAAGLSILTAIWISNSYQTYMKIIRLFIVYILIIDSIENKKQLKVFIMFFILSSAFHASAAIINYYSGIRQHTMGIDRAFGLDLSYGDPNSLASSMVYTIPFIYYFITKKSRIITRIILIAIMMILVWCVILTGSRTGMVGIIVCFSLAAWLGRHRLVLSFVILLSLAALWVVMPDQYRERFKSTADLSSDTGASASARGRLEGLVNGLKMMRDRPILGYGIGNFAVATGMKYNQLWFQSHSLPGQIFGELGLAGTIAFILWIYYLFKNLIWLRRHHQNPEHYDEFQARLATCLIIHIICLLILGLGGHNLYRYNWFLIAGITRVMLKPEFMRLPNSSQREVISQES